MLPCFEVKIVLNQQADQAFCQATGGAILDKLGHAKPILDL